MNERQLDKNAARRLAIIRHAREVTGNVAMTCRYYGISRQVFYVWYRRYQTEGLAGLRDRSTRPQHCPHEAPAEVVGKIIYLRQNYHFGPAKISMYLRRYHDIEISNSGVWRILKRVDLSRLPASQRRRSYPSGGECAHSDLGPANSNQFRLDGEDIERSRRAGSTSERVLSCPRLRAGAWSVTAPGASI